MTHLDGLIERAERVKRLRRLAFPIAKRNAIALLIVVLLGFEVPLLCGRFDIAMPFILALMAMTAWTGWFGLRFLWSQDTYRFWRDLMFDEIPLRVQERGHSLYGFDEDADISIAECYECHIPGDCPICGAE